MAKSLGAQIAARKKEMEDKEINFKALVIALNLGHGFWSSKPDGTDKTHTFENERFRIEDYSFETSDRDWGGFHREVRYNGKRVFYIAGGGEESFIPGEWEKEFNRLYAQARRKERQDKRKEKNSQKTAQLVREREERRRWGL